MSITYGETRNKRAGHEVLRNSGVIICYLEGRQVGHPVRNGHRHECPFCQHQVFTFA